MPVGDILAKMAEGKTLSAGEIDETRLVLNAFQSKLGALSGLLDTTGRLNPNIFSNAAGFSLLPHESGSIYNGENQTIATTTWTTLVGDAASPATWSKGLRVDPATGYIYCTGVPRDSVLLITARIRWASNVASERLAVRWLTDDASEIGTETVVPAALTGDYHQYLTHVRRTPSSETYYKIQVAHYAAGDEVVAGFNFNVTRLR
jgi:hypothetical protein